MPLDLYEDAAEKSKLLQVRMLIERLLQAHDLCADVVLAGRGRVEVFTVLDASWSRVSMLELPGGGFGLRLRSKVADYAGDRNKQRADLEFTTGMVSSFAELKARQGLAWLHASEFIDKQTGAEHTPLKGEPKQ